MSDLIDHSLIWPWSAKFLLEGEKKRLLPYLNYILGGIFEVISMKHHFFCIVIVLILDLCSGGEPSTPYYFPPQVVDSKNEALNSQHHHPTSALKQQHQARPCREHHI